MRADIIRVYKVVHTWTGIVAGMALFIAFYAGALTLFKEPLAHWATPPRSPSSTAERVPISEAPMLITETLRRYPEGAKEFRLRLGAEEPASGPLEWKAPEAGANEHGGSGGHHFVARLERGTVRAEEVEDSQLGEFVDVLHRVVGLPVDGEWSRRFMGVIASLYFVALVSGLIVLLPSLLKDLFALRIGPNLKRMWLDAHNVVGLGSFPFHVVIALTSTVFAFHDDIYFVQNWAIHDGKLAAAFGAGIGDSQQEVREPEAMLPPAELIARVANASSSFEPTVLQYVGVTGPKPTVRVWGHDTRALEPRALGGFALMDPYTGRLVTTEYLPGHQSAAALVLSSFFALHFASYGGAPLKWMYFLLAMLGAWLFYSGNLLWIESRRRRASKRAGTGAIPNQRRDTLLLAATTVGVCLGAVTGISLTLVSAKWLQGHVIDLGQCQRIVYYATFFTAIGWSLIRGAARASVELLHAAAVATLAIPVTSLAAVTVPSLQLWTSTRPDALAVDATALVGALLFAWLARRAAVRACSEPVDSVWAARGVTARGDF